MNVLYSKNKRVDHFVVKPLREKNNVLCEYPKTYCEFCEYDKCKPTIQSPTDWPQTHTDHFIHPRKAMLGESVCPAVISNWYQTSSRITTMRSDVSGGPWRARCLIPGAIGM